MVSSKDSASTTDNVRGGEVFISSSIKDDELTLPPDVTAQALRAMLREASNAIGAENVRVISTNTLVPDGEGSYYNVPKEHDLFYLLDKTTFIASAVVLPGSTEDVVAIVKLANKYLVPLWPVSRGRNVGYGGAAPRVKGSIVLDVGIRMNKVLNVDGENCTALVEPGVSYFSLYTHLQDNGYKHLWIDSPDLGGGSVIGNALDRGSGYTPYGEHFSMHSGMEVVLPTGDVIRTGMGALPENNTWQLFQYGFGPYADGIFSQSNYGIVTKMGTWLMPDPGGYQLYMFSFPKDTDLPAVVEKLRGLRNRMVIQGAATIRNTLIDAAVHGPKSSYSSKKEPLSSEDIDAISKKVGIGRWNVYGGLYGPEPMRKLLFEEIKAELGSIPGSWYEFSENVSREPLKQVIHMREETLKGMPNTYELGWLQWEVPDGACLFFSPISPVTGPDAKKHVELVERRFREFGFDYIGTFAIGLRELHHIVCLTYDKYDPDSRRRAHRCIELLIDDAAAEGYGEYRTHLAYMDQIAGTYNWNNGATLKFNETLKDSLDPNGILAPGKSGIWPKRFRGRGFEFQRTIEYGSSEVDPKGPAPRKKTVEKL